MATLTGFKATNGESMGQQQQQQPEEGQQNPVFVFDEVNVGDGAAAPEGESKQKAAQSDGPHHQAHNNQNQNQHQHQHQHQMSDDAVVLELTTDNNAKPKQKHQQKSTLSPSSNNLNGGSETDQQDTASVSMLAIECAGKSPRQPRRSPLMALFRGKPRESTRRLYTDEDQFEIEWANLSLKLQKKWYQELLGSCSGAGAAKPAEKNQQTKLILNGVDGRIKSGEITAVLGPSGAGKTSLLNGLFGKHRSNIEGSIKVTGAPSKKHLTVCTIPQSDYLISYLTTEESLWFASRLKNCEDDFNHDRNIERVVELLGLQRCRHTRINKLSGGQYKRVSIAQEMLSSPDILVLDEPTSGLDSLTCYRTVKVLRDLVEASKAHNLVNPMSIILTIHQPHREVLDLFHSVYIMAVGGQTLYQGPPDELDSWINHHSGLKLPSKGYNPASFMVEIASEEYGKQPINTLVSKQRLKFKETTQHEYNYHIDTSPQALSTTPPSSRANSNKSDSAISLYQLNSSSKSDKYIDIDLRADATQTRTSSLNKRDIDSRIMTPRSGKNSDGVFMRHVSLMSRRCFLANTRDPLLFTIRVGAHIFIPLVVALIYGPKMGVPNGCPFYMPEINLLEYASVGVEEIREKHDAIRIQFQNVGLHFMVYYAFGLCMLAFTAISFPLIMHVLIKEIRNGWYSLSTFIMGKMLAELPMALILPPISVAIIYTLTGQPSSYLQWRYMVQSVILILIIMIAEAKGLVFGAVCMNSMQTAVFAASVSTVPFILLSGFLIRIHEIPVILQHLAKFSYFKHSVEALIITRYGFGMCPCDPALIPVGGVPRITGLSPNIMSVMDYYVSSYVAPEASTETDEETNIPGNNRKVGKIMEAITTLNPEALSTELATTASPTFPTDESSTSLPVQPTTQQQTTQPTTTSPTTLLNSAPTTTFLNSAPTTTYPTTLLNSAPTTSPPATLQPTTVPPTTGIASTSAPTTLPPTVTTRASITTTMASPITLPATLTTTTTTSAPTTSAPSRTNPETVSPTNAATITLAPTTTTTSTTSAPETSVSDSTTTVAPARRRRRLAEGNSEPESTTESEVDAELIEKKPKQGLFFNKLASLLTRANAFGFSIETCRDVEPFTMKDMKLEDSMLAPLIGYLFLYIVILKFISYFIVEICVKLKL